MAAEDKIIPTALIMANALHGIKAYTSNTYGLPAAKSTRFKNPYTNAVTFFASIYAKSLKVGGGDPTWNHTLVNGENIKALFTPNRNIHYLTLGSIVAFSEFEWNELQITISKAFNIVYPFDIAGPWTVAEIASYNALMGVFSNTAVSPINLLGADGTVLGNFAQGIDWATAWNDIRVPYDATQGIETPFIAPIYRPGSGNYYYRYTGNRRWFGFEGYELYK